LKIFHARKDVLRNFIVAVYVENHLGGIFRKNSNSPRGSETGLAPSIPTRGGDEQGSTAKNADASTTAPSAAATAPSNARVDDPPASSGASDDTTKTKVH